MAARYGELSRRLTLAAHSGAVAEVVRDWDRVRSRIGTWRSLTRLRFNQNTTCESSRATLEVCNAMLPRFTSLEVDFKRRVLESHHRGALEARLGRTLFSRWELDVDNFTPGIEAHMARESQLVSEYVRLLGQASFEVDGKQRTYSQAWGLNTHVDRAVRHKANQVRFAWLSERAPELDRIFGELVALRTLMAKTLGYDNYIALGYRKLRRVGFGEAEVARFREHVRTLIVPLAARIRARQAKDLGLDELRFWDERVYSRGASPRPLGGHDWMLERAQQMFDAMHPEIAHYFRIMVERGLLDLKSRNGKSVGGFCTYMSEFETPFIFANFNGSRGDVRVFTHEMGHALQCWKSFEGCLGELGAPSAETAEIYSISLEYLSWPHMSHFFGDAAEHYRRVHLSDALCDMPYHVAVDHFQHLVYANPDASHDERHAMWRDMEARYLPWRRYEEGSYAARGGLWQQQRHIYAWPFYFIEYSLALSSALQLWSRARQDPDASLQTYLELCGVGGRLPFLQVVNKGGLRSPFDPDCLEGIAADAEAHLFEPQIHRGFS